MAEKLEGHEVEKAKKQIDALINDHPTLKTSLATIQKSADAATKKIDTLYDAALTVETDETKKPALKTKAIEHINAVVALEKEEIAKLVTSKKKLDTTVETALKKKFNDVEAWTALPDGNTTAKAPAAAPTTSKKSKKELFYENTSNTLFQENMKKIEKQTTLKDGVEKSYVLTNIKNLVDKLPDDKKKDAVVAFEAIQKDGKGIQPGTDGGLRADFIKKASAALVGSPNAPTLEECVAAENAWRLLSNHFRIGTKDPTQWKILTLSAGVITEGEAPADSGPAATPANNAVDNNEVVKKDDTKKEEEKKDDKQGGGEPEAKKEEKKEVKEKSLDEVVTAVMDSAMLALKAKPTINFASKETLVFKADSKDCSFDGKVFTYDGKKTEIKMTSLSFDLPVLKIVLAQPNLNVTLETPGLLQKGQKEGALTQEEFKAFLASAVGVARGDSGVKNSSTKTIGTDVLTTTFTKIA